MKDKEVRDKENLLKARAHKLLKNPMSAAQIHEERQRQVSKEAQNTFG